MLVLTNGMTTTGREKAVQAALDKRLEEIGEHVSISRFIWKYANLRTRFAYAHRLAMYFRWLRAKGVTLDPDELVKDNLNCVFESGPVDVATKRRHTDWLNQYANTYLVEKGVSVSERKVSAAAIVKFYQRNDSLLRGLLTGRRESGFNQIRAGPCLGGF